MLATCFSSTKPSEKIPLIFLDYERKIPKDFHLNFHAKFTILVSMLMNFLNTFFLKIKSFYFRSLTIDWKC